MATESTTAFSDNWAYLRTELSWLDRVLMLAVSRYRQDKRNVDRVAQTHADQVSSHWWKGIISLDGNVAYDEQRKVAKPTNTPAKAGYNQQLEARIQASQAQGIVLALPTLRDRLSLTPFEKNAVLLGLAPEVNRRYARLYHYLQGQVETSDNDLPTVELVLRLLCRNDNEWRVARQTIAQNSSLLEQGFLTLLQQPYDTMLTASLKLSEPLVRYLLAESPTIRELDVLLDQTTSSSWTPSIPPFSFSSSAFDGQAIAIPDGGIPETQSLSNNALDDQRQPKEHEEGHLSHPAAAHHTPSLFTSSLNYVEQPNTTWDTLILPTELIDDIQHICHRVRHQETINASMGQNALAAGGASPAEQRTKGTIALFTGAAGTGKSLATEAIATDLQTSLYWLDLAAVVPEDYAALLIDAESVPMVVLKSAHCWLANPPYATLETEYLQQFLARRRSQGALTIFTVPQLERVATRWHSVIDHIVRFPFPDATLRHQLWKKALTPSIDQDKTVDLEVLRTVTLSGKAIHLIVQDGAIAALARQSPMTMDDICQALKRQGDLRALRQLKRAISKAPKKRSRRRSSSTRQSSSRPSS